MLDVAAGLGLMLNGWEEGFKPIPVGIVVTGASIDGAGKLESVCDGAWFACPVLTLYVGLKAGAPTFGGFDTIAGFAGASTWAGTACFPPFYC